MSQTIPLFSTLKKVLRSHAITYQDIANYLNQSEANIKKMFSNNNMSIERLERICQMVGLELSDLVHQMESDTQKISVLTEEQEKILVSDTRLLLVAFLVINTWSFKEIISYYNFSEPELIRYLAQLDRLKLVELWPNNRIKLLTSKQFAWRTNGPIQQYFSKNMQDDFFKCQFNKIDEKYKFMSGLLSEASSQKLIAKIEQLTREYNQLIIEDQKLSLDNKLNFSMILATRPWHPKEFSKYLRIQQTR